MAFWAALPAIASLASNFIGKKKGGGDTQPGAVQLPGFQGEIGEKLSNYIKGFLAQYEPGKEYTGDFVAPTSGYENTGLNRLEKFLSAPELGDLFNASKQNLLDTVGGKFADPNTSPFIKSMTNLSKMNLRDLIDESRRRSGARGNYFSDAAIKEEGRITDRTLANLDAIIGDFTNQERDRQLRAAQLAQAFDQYENFDAPLAKVGASQTYGSLPRLLAQADLEAKYADFGRKQKELSALPGQAQSLFSNNTPYTPAYTNPTTVENGPLGNILGIIGKLNLGALSGKGNIWDKIAGVIKG